MTRADDAEIPDAARAEWVALNETAIPALAKAEAARAEAAGEVKRLLIALLRKGVKRTVLDGRPYSQGWLTKLMREAGLIQYRPRTRRTP